MRPIIPATRRRRRGEETRPGWPCTIKRVTFLNVMQDTQLYKAFPIVRRLAVEKRPHGEEKSRRPPKKEQRNVNRGTGISFSVSPSLHTQIVLTDFETNNLVYMKTDPDCLIADHVSAYLKNLIAYFNLVHPFSLFKSFRYHLINVPLLFFLFFWVSIPVRSRVIVNIDGL